MRLAISETISVFLNRISEISVQKLRVSLLRQETLVFMLLLCGVYILQVADRRNQKKGLESAKTESEPFCFLLCFIINTATVQLRKKVRIKMLNYIIECCGLWGEAL